jgi:hypothetical protein
MIIINTYSYSQDLKAGEIYIQNISGLTYKATAQVYQHSPTFIPRPFILLDWGDGSPLDTLQGGIDGCGNNNTLTNKYSGTHTYALSGNYNISCTDSFRIANLQNITNSSNEKLYLQHQLTINPIWGINYSPSSLNCLVDTFKCCSWVYNSGTFDPDGDSLAYSLVAPNTTNYTMPPASINSSSGDMTFNPTTIGLYAFSMKIDEWRTVSNNLYLIGSTFREMLIVVDSSYLISVNEQSIQNNFFTIYPNPTNGIFTIALNNTNNADIEIYSISGQLVLQQKLTQVVNTIDLTNYAIGMYLVKVTTKDNLTQLKKLVIE